MVVFLTIAYASYYRKTGSATCQLNKRSARALRINLQSFIISMRQPDRVDCVAGLPLAMATQLSRWVKAAASASVTVQTNLFDRDARGWEFQALQALAKFRERPRTYFSSSDPWYKLLKKSCREGLTNPKLIPNALHVAISLLGHRNLSEDELGQDWKVWAAKYPFAADIIRQFLSGCCDVNERRFIVRFSDIEMAPKKPSQILCIIRHPDYVDGCVPDELISSGGGADPAPAAASENESRSAGRPKGAKSRPKVEIAADKEKKANRAQERALKGHKTPGRKRGSGQSATAVETTLMKLSRHLLAMKRQRQPTVAIIRKKSKKEI